MVIRILLVTALASGCFDTSYRCTTDADCDLGANGRCELTHRCTTSDATCPLLRRYAPHSEELSNACFDDRISLLNPCAGGQPPALPEGCALAVCDALPSCCTTGWSDACVQAAQLRCPLTCDTRIAITASSGNRTASFDLRRNSDTWTATPRLDLDTLSWLAPAPNTVEPRLAGLSSTALLVDTLTYPLQPDRTYHSLTSIDLDRDGRDTVALSSSFGAMPVRHAIELLDLSTGTSRSVDAPRSQHLTWGDNDHDAFPDGVAGFNVGYSVLDNIETETATRTLAATTTSTLSNMDTPDAPGIRNFDWIDLDADGRLELAVFGNQIRIHAGDVRLANNPIFNRDCDPPITSASCAAPESAAFAGTALPSLDTSALVVAAFPTRAMYRIELSPLSITPLLDACPTCGPLLALVARDLDGDHRLDLVGLDAKLHVHTALARDNYRFTESTPIPTSLPFLTVDLSVSGMPLP